MKIFLPWLTCNQIGHSTRRHEQGCLLPQHRRHLAFQSIHRRVLPEHVVPHSRVHHRMLHALRRLRHSVRPEIHNISHGLQFQTKYNLTKPVHKLNKLHVTLRVPNWLQRPFQQENKPHLNPITIGLLNKITAYWIWYLRSRGQWDN